MRAMRAVLLTVVATTAMALVSVTPAVAATLTASGPALVAKGATVTITGGGAQPGEAVGIWFHRKGQPATFYDQRRTLTASDTGEFSTTYVADTDYRYYATTATDQSPTVLTALATTTLTGPASVAPRGTVTMTGTTGIAGSTVAIWFHRKGQPATYYEQRRSLTADADGRFTTSYVADTDYRYYAVANGSTSPTVLTVAKLTWLSAMNAYRAAYGVGAVTESSALSAADAAHVTYMFRNNVLSHSEDPGKPYYTAAGNTAAAHSNVAAGSGSISDVGWIDLWMNGPFHALGVLRPSMRTTGFAAANGYAALDVLSDLSAPDPGGWPKSFPSARAPFPFRSYSGGEYPDPLSGCPSSFRNGPVSAPLMVSLGPSAPAVTTASVVFGKAGTPAQQVCVLTESTYTSAGDPGGQSTARALLAENHTIVVYAVSPLAGATRYSLHVTPAGRPQVDVSFTTT